MPFAWSTPLIYYNAAMLAEVGLIAAPKTLEEFVAVAPDLGQRDGDTLTWAAFAHPCSGSSIAWPFRSVVWQHGCQYSDPEFNMGLNQGGAVEAGNLYRSSVADGWASTPAVGDADVPNGPTASMMASTGGLTRLIRDATFELGAAFLHEGPTGFGCSTGSAGMAVPAASDSSR